jgi:hypothetical protein
MVYYISTMLVLGTYLIYICAFHNALPKKHGVLKKTLISHTVLIVLMFLIFAISR